MQIDVIYPRSMHQQSRAEGDVASRLPAVHRYMRRKASRNRSMAIAAAIPVTMTRTMPSPPFAGVVASMMHPHGS